MTVMCTNIKKKQRAKYEWEAAIWIMITDLTPLTHSVERLKRKSSVCRSLLTSSAVTASPNSVVLTHTELGSCNVSTTKQHVLNP